VLAGPRIALRARQPQDVEVLHAELYDDVELFARTMQSAWRPHPPIPDSPFTPAAPSEHEAKFTVVHRESGDVLGSALLFSIDTHNRSAQIGLWLRPACRGRGYGTEAVGVFCRYGFRILGLHRLQMDTLADNVAMVTAAERNGFQLEGRLREAVWVDGRFVDSLVLGLAVDHWSPDALRGAG
jgi:RimJ/RimL family protein N-acetyltransferase